MTPLLTQLHTRIAELVPDVKSKYHVSTGNNLRCKNCGEPNSYDTFGQCKNGELRPITLADVLRAMNELDKEGNFKGFGLAVAVNGMFFRDRKPLCQWDLSKNLNSQSPEVHEFIASIIL